MDNERKFGAGQMISAVVFTALLLLWMDGWSHSIPVMIITAIVALFVYLGFRNSKPTRKLTYSEQVMLERESARRWMMSQQREPEKEPQRPELTLIDGDKKPPPPK